MAGAAATGLAGPLGQTPLALAVPGTHGLKRKGDTSCTTSPRKVLGMNFFCLWLKVNLSIVTSLVRCQSRSNGTEYRLEGSKCRRSTPGFSFTCTIAESLYPIHKRTLFNPPFFCISTHYPAILKMIDNATNTQRYTTEKISTTPAHGGILVTQTREPSLSSRIDEEELDRNFSSHHQFSEVSLGLNATLSAAEKSFKREDYIYVGFFFPSFFSSGPS